MDFTHSCIVRHFCRRICKKISETRFLFCFLLEWGWVIKVKILYKIFGLNPESREGMIVVTSCIGICVNALVAALKIGLGFMSGSVAIVSEGVHNIMDAISSVLTLVGLKLSYMRPTKKHPFGFGRIEYLASLLISLLICVAGFEMVKTSLQRFLNPKALSITYFTVGWMGLSALVKLGLGQYLIRKGRASNSDSLVGVGIESRNDCLASAITIVGSLLYIWTGIILDGGAGILMSLIIIKSGLTLGWKVVSDLIGQSSTDGLARKVCGRVSSVEGIENVADMTLHNYGPNRYRGTCNVELDACMRMKDVYRLLHPLQLSLREEYGVHMVFGVYAVNVDPELHEDVCRFVQMDPNIRSYHALFYDRSRHRIYVDFVLEYGDFDWELIEEAFVAYMYRLYPEDQVVLTLETEFIASCCIPIGKNVDMESNSEK